MNTADSNLDRIQCVDTRCASDSNDCNKVCILTGPATYPGYALLATGGRAWPHRAQHSMLAPSSSSARPLVTPVATSPNPCAQNASAQKGLNWNNRS